MFNLFKKPVRCEIVSPVDGFSIPLEEVPDPVFAQKMMGEGIGFRYAGEWVASPMNATVLLVAETRHAVGLKGANGAEVLLHIGMDTVELQGRGLEVFVKPGQKVKAGDPLVRIDRAFMEQKQIDLTTMIVVTNSREYQIEIMPAGQVKTGDLVLCADR
ncbi:PTS sugar transporter subunit IIA [Holdemania massiliensis]|uniref:PTS sugar transporter subunit IIA n=1 Tax=Holdemania massiliensis TaxID=1468449 RepID=UPI002675622D|nr:PTS glucose transporter subunit IIA [Holdemania massiliensis]